jgi:PAS domain S-box-containing protein
MALMYRPAGRSRFGIRVLRMTCALLVAPVCAAVASPSKHVLVLQGESPDLPGNTIVIGALESTVRKELGPDVEFHVEQIETTRFSSASYEGRLAQAFEEKYKGLQFSLVVAFTPPAVDFVLHQQFTMFPGVPVLLGLVEQRFLDGRSIPDRSGVVTVRVHAAATLRLALDTYPAARHALIVGGTSPSDRAWESAVRDDLRYFEPGVPITYDTESSLDDMLRTVGRLPADTIVLYVSMTRDGAGTLVSPTDVLERLRSSAAVPIYGLSSTYVGHGVVGGVFLDFNRHGVDLGRHAVRLLQGDTPPASTTPPATVVDWRELKRFQMTTASLPPWARVEFRDDRVWPQPRTSILTISAVVLVEAMLLLAFVCVLARRRRDVQALHREAPGAVAPDAAIAERTLADIALAESETRFQRMADALPVAIWMSDENACSYFNTRWLQMTGRSLEQERGFGWLENVHPDDRGALVESYHRAFRAREGFSVEHRIRHHDGVYRWLMNTGMPRYMDGAFHGFIGGCVDITDRKDAEQSLRDLNRRLIVAQEAERRRIARELHDHLSQQIALLAIELQQMKTSPPSREALAARMHDMWQRTSEIATDVHNISHQLHPSKLEALGLVKTIRAYARDLSRENFAVHVAEQNVPSTIAPDVSLCLFRVLEEALTNVSRHSGAIEAQVTLTGVDGDLALRVSDAGCGFTSSRQRATGLGLVSMRERLESLGGWLSITSARGKGTVVEARVPCKRPPDPREVPDAPRPIPRLVTDTGREKDRSDHPARAAS